MTKQVAVMRWCGMVVCCLGFAITLNAQTPIPTNQLAAIYRFDEGNGTTAADASWNDNTGTISNAVWTTAGKYGSCLSFNGAAWVTVTDSPSLDLTNGMTLEAWVFPASAISDWKTFIMKEIPGSGVGGNYGYMLAAEPGGHPVIDVSTTSGNYQQAMGPSILPSNTWTHLAGTYDGTALRLYVNGTEVAETPVTGSILTSLQPLRIGGNAIWPEYFSGKIDDIRIYNQALSQSQIQTNMNGLDFLTVTLDNTNRANAQATIPTNQWAAIYRFNEGTGMTTADASWNNNTGTISNAVWTTAGKYGSCLSFNGAAWVTVTDSPSLDLTNGMTLEAWVYPASAISYWETFIMKEIPGSGVGGNYGYMLAAEPGGHPVIDVSTTSGNYQQAMGPSILPSNTWTHLAGTYDGTALRLYVNGTEVAETPVTGSILTSPQPLRIGGNAIWPEYFSGKIDDIRIYNQALNQSQIQTNMNGLDILTVTADSTNRVYGSANPAFTGSVTGLLAGDNITATFTTVAAPADPVGDYDVVPSLNAPDGSLNNYFVVTNVGTLTIVPATPVLTLSASAITYGQTLADSSLSSSVATNAENNAPVAGGFAFEDDTIAPNAGSTNVSVIFTPGDAADYNNVTNMVSVTVTPPGIISITSIVLLETNHKLISGTGSANVTYIIQASPDLIHWQNIGTATAGTNGVFGFEDADAGNFTTRFYRVSLP